MIAARIEHAAPFSPPSRPLLAQPVFGSSPKVPARLIAEARMGDGIAVA